MKKILFLLLLAVAGYGQTSTGQEQEFDYGIKNNSTQTITTPTYLTTTGTDGTQGKIPSAYIEKTADKISTITGYSETSYPNEKAAHDALDLKLNISDLPTNLTLYPTTAASDVGGYVKMVTDIHDVDYNTVAVDVSTPTITGTAQLVSQRISAPGVLIGQPGVFNITTFGNIKRLSGTGTANFYFEVYHRDLAGTETLICTSSVSAIVSLSTYTEFTASGIWDDGDFISTDRIVIKTYANRIAGGTDPVYQFQFGGTQPVRTLLPVPFSVVDAGYEMKINKSDSYTASSSTTYASTKALVDGLSLKQSAIIYNVKDYGALGNGVADDITSINSAITAVNGLGGGVLFFPAGTYLVSGAVSLKSKVHLQGSGVDVTTIKNTSNDNTIGLDFPASATTNCGVYDMTIDGNSSSVSFPIDDAVGNAIRLNEVSNSYFERLKIVNSVFNGISVYNLSNENTFTDIEINDTGKTGTPPATYSMNGIFFEAGSSRNRVLNCRIKNTVQNGIWIGARDADNYDNEIINVWISEAGSDGIHIGDELTANKSYRSKIINPYIFSSAGVGIRLFHAGTGNVIDAEINGGIIDDCNLGIYIDYQAIGTKVMNVYFKNNGNYGITNNGGGSFVSNNKSHNHLISNLINNSLDSYVANNDILDTGEAYEENLTIKNLEIDTGGTLIGVTKSMVGLSNVDNTSDLNKPISTATQTALNLKLDLNPETITNGNTNFGDNTVSNAYRIITSDNGGVANDTGIGVDGAIGSQVQWYTAIEGHKWYAGTGGLKMTLTNTGQLTASKFIGDATLTGTPTAPTATAGTNTTQIATTAFVQNAIGNYKKYVAMLTQTSTSAPTAKVLENTLGGTVVWTYSSTGVYVGTLTGAFTADKSPVILTSNNSGVTLTGGASGSTNFVGIETKVNGTLTDGSMTDSFIEIRVYP